MAHQAIHRVGLVRRDVGEALAGPVELVDHIAHPGSQCRVRGLAQLLLQPVALCAVLVGEGRFGAVRGGRLLLRREQRNFGLLHRRDRRGERRLELRAPLLMVAFERLDLRNEPAPRQGRRRALLGECGFDDRAAG